MTTVFQSYFNKAELALASYSDFASLSRNANGAFKSSDVKDRLTRLGGLPFFEKASDFSAVQADKFLERFDVLDQYTTDELLNGFSATVFRDKASGQLYFVNRGTDSVIGDVLPIDATLAIGGKPLSQIVSMVNYYLRAKAGDGGMAQQIEAYAPPPILGVPPVAEAVNFRLSKRGQGRFISEPFGLGH